MKYQTIEIDGLNVFYREAGKSSKPNFLLLHGFPTASHYFRNLMPYLEDHFHLIAPDLVSFGQTESPDHTKFTYTFENLTNVVDQFIKKLNLQKFYLYVFDYGAPIGFELACRHPESILGIVSQNGNIYQEGLGKKWEGRKEYWNHPTAALREQYKSAFAPETIINQYTFGEEPDSIGPDGYTLDIHYSERPGYDEYQSDLIFDYQNNVKNYPRYQQYVKDYQPEIIAAWGKNDPSFIYPGAQAFAKDDPNAQVELLDASHFALESQWQKIGQLILDRWAK